MSMALEAGFPAGWASLPKNLLDCIIDRLLPNSSDIVRFRAVCTDWESVAWENFLRRQLPFLVVPMNLDTDGWMSYHLSTTWGDMELNLPFHVRIYGYSCGWLILSKLTEIFLFDPYSDETIRLPPLQRLAEESRRLQLGFPPLTQAGALLSATPDTDPDGYVLMVTYGYGGHLAFIRRDDPNWTYVDCLGNHLHSWTNIQDHCLALTYHKGLFFSLHRGGALLSIDVKSSDFTVKKLAPRFTEPPRMLLGSFETDAYFVKHHEKGEEHLWMVLRKLDCHLQSCDFQIYKLSDDDGGDGGGGNEEYYWSDDDDGGGGGNEEYYWTPVTNLGDSSLFLGERPSYSFLPGGSQPNTVFFYGDNLLNHGRLCILGFNLEDGTIIFRPLDHIKKNIGSHLNPIAFVPQWI